MKGIKESKKVIKDSKKITAKAKQYGYAEKHAEDIGMARARNKKGRAPVAKDTNKTRRSY